MEMRLKVAVTKIELDRSLEPMIFPLGQLAVSGVCRVELAYILALTHRQVLI